MICLLFLLFQISFNIEIKIYQNEAILGEPVIAEANIDFNDITNYSNEYYIEF